jgi:hypothetical protein
MTGSPSPIPPTSVVDAPEPTLATLLIDVVREGVPSRFYQLLQLGVPFGIQLATMGWWRSAGWGFTAAAFGAWALAERAVRGADDPANPPLRFRVLRWATAAVAAAIPAALLLELFIHLLGSSPIS